MHTLNFEIACRFWPLLQALRLICKTCYATILPATTKFARIFVKLLRDDRQVRQQRNVFSHNQWGCKMYNVEWRVECILYRMEYLGSNEWEFSNTFSELCTKAVILCVTFIESHKRNDSAALCGCLASSVLLYDKEVQWSETKKTGRHSHKNITYDIFKHLPQQLTSHPILVFIKNKLLFHSYLNLEFLSHQIHHHCAP